MAVTIYGPFILKLEVKRIKEDVEREKITWEEALKKYINSQGSLLYIRPKFVGEDDNRRLVIPPGELINPYFNEIKYSIWGFYPHIGCSSILPFISDSEFKDGVNPYKKEWEKFNMESEEYKNFIIEKLKKGEDLVVMFYGLEYY